ncbi:MAG: signal peptide peptidase SppA, partial [Candidatus Hydrogenedentes bacterium]|nr:signal peptide peptidase SppA [Candidatus Hydrogenedentota bacterium]
QIGDYKTAGEMFSRTEPSEPGKEDMNRLLDGLYESCVNMIADARHKPADEVKRLIDAGPYPAERALEAGLIDSVAPQDEFLEGLKREYGDSIPIDNDYERVGPPTIDMQRPLKSQWSVARYFLRVHKWSWKDSIGLIYLEGTIVPGSGGPGAAWSGDIRDALKTAAEDDSIKAVVLRVDSPGGSVTASEVILRAAQALQKKKPLVVSMGSTAASGGYYVSCGANAIFADETTLTGSIGVIGGKLVSTGLWNKLGVNWFAYQRGANADLYSGAHPFDERQRADVTRYMLDAYGTFKEHVTSGRGTKLAKGLDELAGGRVFTGKQALDLGLVDKIGGLKAAIAYAAELVSLKDYQVQVIPQPKDAAEMLIDTFFGSPHRPSDLDLDARAGRPNLANLQTLAGPPEVAAAAHLLEGLDARHVRIALGLLRRIQLLSQEGIAMIMPQVFAIE